MAHTFKTDPWHVKEARGHPTQFARDISKRLRARERREMERITRDIEAWGATLREFSSDTNRDGWQY